MVTEGVNIPALRGAETKKDKGGCPFVVIRTSTLPVMTGRKFRRSVRCAAKMEACPTTNGGYSKKSSALSDHKVIEMGSGSVGPSSKSYEPVMESKRNPPPRMAVTPTTTNTIKPKAQKNIRFMVYLLSDSTRNLRLIDKTQESQQHSQPR